MLSGAVDRPLAEGKAGQGVSTRLLAPTVRIGSLRQTFLRQLLEGLEVLWVNAAVLAEHTPEPKGKPG